MKIQAVAFDIDGTLYPNSRMYAVSAGIALRNIKLLRAFRAVRLQLRTIESIDSFYQLQAELMAQKLGTSFEHAEVLVNREFYSNWEKIFYRIQLFSGVIETLSWLKSHSIKLAVLSDFPVDNKLKLLKINQYFDVALCSEQIGYLKPNPKTFNALTDALKLDASNILFVGNSFNFDILGADRVGMPTLHIARRAPALSPALLTTTSYRKILHFLKNL